MEVKITNQSGKILAAVSGRIDTTTAEKFQQDIAPLMQGDNPDIELDCSELVYTSSQGLRLLLILQKSVMARQGKLMIKGLQPMVKEVFDITGFSNIFNIQ